MEFYSLFEIQLSYSFGQKLRGQEGIREGEIEEDRCSRNSRGRGIGEFKGGDVREVERVSRNDEK